VQGENLPYICGLVRMIKYQLQVQLDRVFHPFIPDDRNGSYFYNVVYITYDTPQKWTVSSLILESYNKSADVQNLSRIKNNGVDLILACNVIFT
jgi:hypothetical protein